MSPHAWSPGATPCTWVCFCNSVLSKTWSSTLMLIGPAVQIRGRQPPDMMCFLLITWFSSHSNIITLSHVSVMRLNIDLLPTPSQRPTIVWAAHSLMQDNLCVSWQQQWCLHVFELRSTPTYQAYRDWSTFFLGVYCTWLCMYTPCPHNISLCRHLH